MTTEADTARIFRHAATSLTLQDTPIRPEEVGMRRFRAGDGSTICMALHDDRMGRRLIVQWRQQPQLREMDVQSPIGIRSITTPEDAAEALIAIASTMDNGRSGPMRDRDRKTLALCAAICSVKGCLQPRRDGSTTRNRLRIWAATGVTPPFLRMDRDGRSFERHLAPFIEGFRTTRATMVLQPSSSMGIQKERFTLSGIMDMIECSTDGGVVEAMRQVAVARSLADPSLRAIEMIDAALAEAGA